jgi:ABC-type transport system involved in multi-copper enzyme maturation permease subunit
MMCLYFVQKGINQYRTIIEDKEKFLETERLKTDLYFSYSVYANYGFRLQFLPSPLSVLFVNSTVISELSSNVDVASLLNIYKSYKGRVLFAEQSGGFKDFSGIILLFGSMIVLYFGFETFLNKDYFRFISGFIQPRRMFYSIIGSRLVLLLVYFLVCVAGSLLLIGLNRIDLMRNEYRHLNYYLLVMSAMLIFFFILGLVAGTLKSRFIGFFLLISIWFVFVFLIPGIIQSLIADSSENITSSYDLELKKLQAHMGFERKAMEAQGVLENSKENTQSERDLMESYWKNELRKIQGLEKNMENDMRTNIRNFQIMSSVVPSSFYISVGNEVSSRGYKNFVDYFSYLQKLKEGFVRFYIDKRFYSNFDDVELYIKGEENIYYSRNLLPDYFIWGICLNLIYIILSIGFAYYRFNRCLVI